MLAPGVKDGDEKAQREAALKGIEVEKERLIKLANSRAQVVKDALIKAGLDQNRIEIKKPEKTDAKQGEYASVMMGATQ